MIIMDTDALSHIQKRTPVGSLIEVRLAHSRDRDFRISEVSASEMVNGATSLVSRRKKESGDFDLGFSFVQNN